jgi:hypothetical protein
MILYAIALCVNLRNSFAASNLLLILFMIQAAAFPWHRLLRRKHFINRMKWQL